MNYNFASYGFILCILSGQFLCSDNNAVERTISPFVIRKKIINFKDSINLKEIRNKWKKESLKLNNDNCMDKKRGIYYWTKLKNTNMTTKSTEIQNEFKVRKRELGYFKTLQAAASGPTVWDFGGTWSSALAGVRFRMDSRGTVGVDKNVPVKILDKADDETDAGSGTATAGFLDKGWLAKASAPYGRRGPLALFAVNRREKSVAVFVGFAHSQNNKDLVTGMWSLGKDCKNNLDTHQSVFNIPDVLCRDST